MEPSVWDFVLLAIVVLLYAWVDRLQKQFEKHGHTTLLDPQTKHDLMVGAAIAGNGSSDPKDENCKCGHPRRKHHQVGLENDSHIMCSGRYETLDELMHEFNRRPHESLLECGGCECKEFRPIMERETVSG